MYKSGDNDHTYTMCLKKKTLKQLLDDYPDAKTYYMKRAKDRRIEFRRKMKIHEQKYKINNPNKDEEKSNSLSSSSSNSDDNSSSSDDDS